jgi:hypothetical protein
MTTKALSLPKHITTFINKIELMPVNELIQLSDGERIKQAAIGNAMELAGRLYSGYALLGLKEKMGYGNYMAALVKSGKSQDTAERDINLVKLAMRTPANVWPALSVIPPSKLLLMSSWSDEELQHFFQGAMVRGITMEAAQSEPLRELEHRIKASRPESELEKKLDTLDKKLETAHLENIELKKQLKNKTRITAFPEFVESARHESTMLAEKANLCFDDIEKLYQELENMGRQNNGHDPDYTRHWNIATTTLYHNFKGVIARALKTLIELDNTLPESVTGPISPAYYLEAGEITAALEQRELLVEQHTHEAVMRKNQREMSKPRGRGRPANKGDAK